MKEGFAFLAGFVVCLALIVYAEMGRSPAADVLFEGYEEVKAIWSNGTGYFKRGRWCHGRTPPC